MSGLFSIINKNSIINHTQLKNLASLSTSRGKNSSGLISYNDHLVYQVHSAHCHITELISSLENTNNTAIFAYTGLLSNYGNGSLPANNNHIYAITDSLILNKFELCQKFGLDPQNTTDAQLLTTWISTDLSLGIELLDSIHKMYQQILGTISAFILLPELGKMVAFSNSHGLYTCNNKQQIIIASEKRILKNFANNKITAITLPQLFEIPASSVIPEQPDAIVLPDIKYNHNKADLSLLKYQIHNIKRCARCILPETMPFISFDKNGVCNYCHNYKVMNAPKSKNKLLQLIEPYKKSSGYDCIIPFSGGRDSCYALHLIVNELKLKPLTYTYDWGMVTEIGHRNISRMCSTLGIENILVAADIEKKRKNVAMNLNAWLKKPDLGMLNILTAGDKHFFQYVDQVKKDYDIRLNLWGVNPLEVTHFKTGFLGLEPNFALQGVYTRGLVKQLRYQSKRLKAMLKSPDYFNSSIWDTLTGEYYRSFTKQEDYYHMFDYWQWNEDDVDNTLQTYGWECTSDSSCSWRIGDGVAGFYNYVYYTVAGFTEHDTFRSNQVREGQLTRDQALKLVQQENAPRYENLQWFFKVLDIDFNDSINIVNNIPKLYSQGK